MFLLFLNERTGNLAIPNAFHEIGAAGGCRTRFIVPARILVGQSQNNYWPSPLLLSLIILFK